MASVNRRTDLIMMTETAEFGLYIAERELTTNRGRFYSIATKNLAEYFGTYRALKHSNLRRFNTIFKFYKKRK